MNLAFTWFWTKGFGSKLRGQCFYVIGRLRILIGFYRRGVYLWDPFENDTIAVRFGMFRRELNRKQLHCACGDAVRVWRDCHAADVRAQ